MGTDAKPLHVRVAEALGCEAEDDAGWVCRCKPPKTHRHSLDRILRYDTDWSATGPLIERFGLTLLRGERGWYAIPEDEVPWVSEYPDVQMLLDGHLPLYDPCPTPLNAVCERILAPHAAGKLPKP